MPHLITACVLATAVLLGGCVIGNDFKVTRHTTVGQELVDLDAAKAKGLINDAEYAKARADLLKWSEVPAEGEAKP